MGMRSGLISAAVVAVVGLGAVTLGEMETRGGNANVTRMGETYLAGDGRARRVIANSMDTRALRLEVVEAYLAAEMKSPAKWPAEVRKQQKETADGAIHDELMGRLDVLKSLAVFQRAQDFILTEREEEAEKLVAGFLEGDARSDDALAILNFVAVRAWKGEAAVRESIAAWKLRVPAAKEKGNRVLGFLHMSVGERDAAFAHFVNAGDIKQAQRALVEAGKWKELAEFERKHVDWQSPESRKLLFREFGGEDVRKEVDALEAELTAKKKFGMDTVYFPFVAGMDRQVKMYGVVGDLRRWQETQLNREKIEDAAKAYAEMNNAGKKTVARGDVPRDTQEAKELQAMEIYFLGAHQQSLDMIGLDLSPVNNKTAAFYNTLMDEVWNRGGTGWATAAAEVKKISAEGRALWGDRVRDAWIGNPKGADISIMSYLEEKTPNAREVLDELLTNRMPAKDQAVLINAVAEAARKNWDAVRMLDLAEVLINNGHKEEAEKILEKAFSPERISHANWELIKLAEERKDWERALKLIDRFEVLDRNDKWNPEIVWWRGEYLRKSGKEAQGLKLQQAAAKALLGWGPSLVAKAAIRAGRMEEARALYAMDGKICGNNMGNLYLWPDAAMRGNFVEAARRYQEMIAMLDPQQEWVFDMRRLRAMAAMQEGRVKDVEREAAMAHEAMPGAIELVTQLVPQLDQAGEKKLADQIFAEVWSFNLAMVKEYPASARHYKRLAAMAKACKRNEEEGKGFEKRFSDLVNQ